MKTLQTDRLTLRDFTLEDAVALHREIYSDHAVVEGYNGGKTFSLEEVQGFLPRRFGRAQFGYWAVIRKTDGELLGQVHLDAYVNAGWYDVEDDLCPFQKVEVHLGFAFGKRFWGQGYAAEACRAVIRFAFADLRLERLVGGADCANVHSVRLHERLGFRLSPSGDGKTVNAVLRSPLTDYSLRAFRPSDRSALSGFGVQVIDWWQEKGPEASLHIVAVKNDTDEIVGRVQAMDAGYPLPSRRPGQCHFCLDVAPDHRRRGIGGALCAAFLLFAQRRGARLLYTSYIEHDDAPARPFLEKRGFTPLERFYPSSLDVAAFDPAPFESALERVRSQGIQLVTYAEAGDSGPHRRKLYALEQLARSTQPFREVGPYIPPPFEKWEEEFARRDPALIFLAVAPQDDAWIGVVTGLEWYFTGVDPAWRGKGIATALKLQCIAAAKGRGIVTMETENHGDNAAMLAVNRRLGFVFSTPEVACIKMLP